MDKEQRRDRTFYLYYYPEEAYHMRTADYPIMKPVLLGHWIEDGKKATPIGKRVQEAPAHAQ